MTETMTAEDMQKINEILEKYHIQKWYPVWRSDNTHPCEMLLSPSKIDTTEAVVLIGHGPNPDMDNPKYDSNGDEWVELGAEAQAQILADLQASVKNIEKNAGDSKDIQGLRQEMTMLTQMIMQSQMQKKVGDK